MPNKQPLLGSLAVQAPSSTPQTVHVTPTTCNDLTLFKDLMREYRKLDDSITVRYNRTTAQFRDRDRSGISGKGSTQDQACAHLWKELVENWKRRAEIIDYCVNVLDASLNAEQSVLHSGQPDLEPSERRRLQGKVYAEQVKRKTVHDELTVEAIVRRRSLEAFRSRCKYFDPPKSDAEARKWWDMAQSKR